MLRLLHGREFRACPGEPNGAPCPPTPSLPPSSRLRCGPPTYSDAGSGQDDPPMPAVGCQGTLGWTQTTKIPARALPRGLDELYGLKVWARHRAPRRALPRSADDRRSPCCSARTAHCPPVTRRRCRVLGGPLRAEKRISLGSPNRARSRVGLPNSALGRGLKRLTALTARRTPASTPLSVRPQRRYGHCAAQFLVAS